MDRGGIHSRGRGPSQAGRHSSTSAGRGRGGHASSGGAGRSNPQALPPTRGGRGGRPTGKVVPITSAAKKNIPTVEELAATATNTELSSQQRLSALKQLQKALTTAEGRQRALKSFDDVSARVLCLLWDAESVICTAAVGVLKAWLGEPSTTTTSVTKSATPPAPGMDPGSRILDSVLPVLSSGKIPDVQGSRTSTGTALLSHQVKALLLVIKEGLAKVPGFTAFRRGSQVLAAAKGVLEDTQMGSEVIEPALETALQAMKVHHVQVESATTLAEVVVACARSREVPTTCYPLLTRVMHAVSAVWESSRGPQRGEWEEKLVEEIEKKSVAEKLPTSSTKAKTSSKAAHSGQQGGSVLSLTACVAPLLVRSANKKEASAGKYMLRLLSAFAVLIQQENIPASKVQELCSYANIFITIMLKPPSASTTTAGAETPRSMTTFQPSLLQRPQQPDEHAVLRAVVELSLGHDESGMVSALGHLGINAPEQERVVVKVSLEPEMPSSLASTARKDENTVKSDSDVVSEAYAVIAAGVRLCRHALEIESVRGRPVVDGAIVTDVLNWLNEIPKDSPLSPEIKQALCELSLPPHGPLSHLRSSTNPAIVKPVALLYVQLFARIPRALHASLEHMAASTSALGTQDNGSSLAFDVNVLLAVSKSGFPSKKEEDLALIWRTSASVLQACVEAQNERILALAPKFLQLSQVALEQLQEVTHKGYQCTEAIELASIILSTTKVAPALAAHALRWQVRLIPQLIIDANGTREMKAVHSALESTMMRFKDQDPVVRLGAYSVAESVVQFLDSNPSTFFSLENSIETMEALHRLLQAALRGIQDDGDEKVAQHAQRIVQACSVPTALFFLSGQQLAPVGENTSDSLYAKDVLSTVLEPNKSVFSSSQLAQVLEFMAGAMPSSVLGSLLAAGGGKQKESAGLYTWIKKLMEDMEGIEPLKESDEAASEAGSVQSGAGGLTLHSEQVDSEGVSSLKP